MTPPGFAWAFYEENEEEPYNWTDTEAEVQAVTDWRHFRHVVAVMAEEQNKGTG